MLWVHKTASWVLRPWEGHLALFLSVSNVFLHLTSISYLSCPLSPSHLSLLSLIHSRDSNNLTCSLTKIAQLSELQGTGATEICEERNGSENFL